jgi:hypothetical protein
MILCLILKGANKNTYYNLKPSKCTRTQRHTMTRIPSPSQSKMEILCDKMFDFGICI